MPRKLRRLAAFSALAVVALIAAEVAARVDDWIRLGIPFTHTPDYDHDLRYQDSFGTRGRSNGRYRRWVLDSNGFRGPDIARTPTPGCARIIVLGASETFGLYESENHEYVAQLRERLEPFGCYEVVNAAIAGAGLRGIIRLWDNYAAAFAPTAVIVYPSPAFYLSARPPTWPRIPGKPETAKSLPFRPRLIEQLKNAWSTPEFLQRYRLRKWIAQDTAGKPPGWAFDSTPPDRLDSFMSDLDSLTRVIQARGAQPILMTHAMRFTVPPKPSDAFMLLDWRSSEPRASTNALLDMERDAAQGMRDYAAQRGVCLVDLAAALSGQREYFADFAHFTDEGSAAVSSLIARQLLGAAPDTAADDGATGGCLRARGGPARATQARASMKNDG